MDYEIAYKRLVIFLNNLIREADELQTYDDNMENLSSHLETIGALEK